MFSQLLQVALGNRNELTRLLTSDEWMALLEEAKRQTIVGVLMGGLERLPQEQRPPKRELMQWIGQVHYLEQGARVKEERLVELTRLFDEAGWVTCVLKGVGVAQLYPNPYRRQCSDIDLWVNGDRKAVMTWLRSKFLVRPPVWHNVAAQILDDVPVEIHFHPSWSWNPWHNSELQSFFEYEWSRIDCRIPVNSYRVPSVEFQAVACLSHMYRHMIAAGIGLRHVIDYFYIVRRLKEDGRGKTVNVVRMIEKCGMRKFLGATMWVLESIFGMNEEWLLCEPNEKEGRFLLSELLASGDFGHYRKGKPMPANSLRRYYIMVRHYPGEVLWMPAWKVWHKCWRLLNK